MAAESRRSSTAGRLRPRRLLLQLRLCSFREFAGPAAFASVRSCAALDSPRSASVSLFFAIVLLLEQSFNSR
jgi:hypothetical protein